MFPCRSITSVILAGAFCMAAPLFSLAATPAVAVPSTDTGSGQRVIELSPLPVDRGYLYIAVHPEVGKLTPPVEILLTDPDGHRLGKDPRTGASYSELSPSYYDMEGLDDDETGEPGPSSAVIDIVNPVDGGYTLQVIGVGEGRYDMEVTGSDSDFKPFHAEFLGAETAKGRVDEYALTFKGGHGGDIAVRQVVKSGPQ